MFLLSSSVFPFNNVLSLIEDCKILLYAVISLSCILLIYVSFYLIRPKVFSPLGTLCCTKLSGLTPYMRTSSWLCPNLHLLSKSIMFLTFCLVKMLFFYLFKLKRVELSFVDLFLWLTTLQQMPSPNFINSFLTYTLFLILIHADLYLLLTIKHCFPLLLNM